MPHIHQTLKIRSQHHDSDVRLISHALLEHLRLFPSGWVAQAIKSPQMGVYKNSLEKVLILEKTVIHHFLQDFWISAISSPKTIPEKIIYLQQNYTRINQDGWLSHIMSITPAESSLILGKPIQTNRIPRYHNLFQQVIAPIFEKNTKNRVTVLDAGSSSGIGVHAAKKHHLPIKTWIGVDKEDHRVNLPWILTCSTRIQEITSSKFVDSLKLMLSLPRNTQILRGDIENLPQSLAENSIDIYLALFSYYQLHRPDKALNEALRVLKPNGILVITDHIHRTGPRTYHFRSPSPKHPLLSLVFQKSDPSRVRLVHVHEWQDTDLIEGQKVPIPKKQDVISKIYLHNSHQ